MYYLIGMLLLGFLPILFMVFTMVYADKISKDMLKDYEHMKFNSYLEDYTE